MLLDDATRRYWRTAGRDLAVNTRNDYSRTFARFTAWLAEQNITDIEAVTSDHVEDYLTCLADAHLSKKTISNHWVALSSLWTWAESKLTIPHILRGHVACPKVPKHQPQPYTKEDVERMLRACRYNAAWGVKPDTQSKRHTALRDTAIIMVLVDTGIRASELCALTVADYNPRRSDLQIQHGKGDKSRTVPLGVTASDALDDYLDWRQRPPGEARRRKSDRTPLAPDLPLFATGTGHAMRRDELLRMISSCAQRAGVTNANLHRFRHTFAINYLRQYPNVYTLQRVLGHSSLDTVRLYLAISEADIHDAHKRASVADAWRL